MEQYRSFRKSISLKDFLIRLDAAKIVQGFLEHKKMYYHFGIRLYDVWWCQTEKGETRIQRLWYLFRNPSGSDSSNTERVLRCNCDQVKWTGPSICSMGNMLSMNRLIYDLPIKSGTARLSKSPKRTQTL